MSKGDAFDSKLLSQQQEADAKEAVEKLKQQYRDQALLYREVFNSYGAIRVLEDLKEKFLESASFVPGRELNDVCYYEGQKSVIKYITTLIEYKYE